MLFERTSMSSLRSPPDEFRMLLAKPLHKFDRAPKKLRFDPPRRTTLNADVAPNAPKTFCIRGDRTFSGLPWRRTLACVRQAWERRTGCKKRTGNLSLEPCG